MLNTDAALAHLNIVQRSIMIRRIGSDGGGHVITGVTAGEMLQSIGEMNRFLVSEGLLHTTVVIFD